MTSLATIPSNQVTPLLTNKGKVVGQRLVFGGTVKASDVRKALKAANPKLKGSELTVKVNEVVTGKNTVAWAEMQVAIEGMRSAGYTPDHCDVRKSSGVLRFVKPTEPKAAPAPKLTAESVAAMTPEEKAAALMLLQAAAQA